MEPNEFRRLQEARDLFLKRYANGERDFTGIDLRSVSFCRRGDTVLNKINLSKANLHKVYLLGAMLFEANFTEANMEKMNLEEAYLIKANLSRANLKEAKLSKANLTESDLRGANLTGADLSEANLTEADLRGADLTEADFTKTDLTGADLSGANLTNVRISEETVLYQTILSDHKPDEFHFRVIDGEELLKSHARGKMEFNHMIIYRADLSNANLEGVDFGNTKFKYVNLSGANLRFAELSRAKFIHCNLSNADLSSSIQVITKFIYSDLRGVQRKGVIDGNSSKYFEVNLEGADILPRNEEPFWFGCDNGDGGRTYWNFNLARNGGCTPTVRDKFLKPWDAKYRFLESWPDEERGFTGIDLRNIHRSPRMLNNINLSEANLQGAYLRNEMLFRANLTMANMEGTDLSHSCLINANLSRANLQEAKLRKTNLTEADLKAANLTQADLRGADLTKADLKGANLTGSDLRGANLIEADLSGANLTKARISEETVFYQAILPDRKPDESHFRVIEGEELLKSHGRGKMGLRNMIIYRADLSNANLEGIDFTGAKFKYVNLSGANLRATNLSCATFIHCNLSHADMAGSIHVSTHFIHCDLSSSQRGDIIENRSTYVEVNFEGSKFPACGEEFCYYYGVIRDDGKSLPGYTYRLYPIDIDIPF